MTRLQWDAPGERIFHAGTDRGVLYPMGKSGVPWNGLVKVGMTPTGGASAPRHYDGQMVANPATPEAFGGTLSAFTYPEEFEECDGTGSNGKGLLFDLQPRKPFNLSWRTKIGNDTEGIDHGYQIHLLYNAMAAPSPMDYNTLSNSTTPGAFSWALTAKPVIIPGRRSTPHLIIDTTKTKRPMVSYLEDILYGTSARNARLPGPAELIDLYDKLQFFKIVPSPETGINGLIEADEADIMGYSAEGFYQATPDTNLKSTGLPGEYTLEQ